MTNINKKNVLISFISIIWCIVSIWAISILTIFQANAQNDDDIPNMQKQINFSWINNNAWVLKSLTFTKSWNQSEAINSFYMNYNNVILNYPNIITNWGNISENGIIIWWKENKTDSINTPIIWWSNIKTSWDSTSFWWEHNTIEWSGTSIWWSYNTIIWDNTIIWWENNNVEWKNNIILWWENNNISWNNIIAAWEQIKVNNNASNSFIFSNDSSNLFEFTPEAGNTFYINSVWGLWFNWDWTEKSTVIHWWVLIWEIDLTQWCTESNDIGIMWTANSCLLACTEFSLNNWWSLLENSERCINWCRNEPNCIEPPVIPDIEPEDYSAYCTWTVFSWATPCFNNFHPEIYNNVVFTNNYVNECPNNQNELDNPCTYKCLAWYSFGDGTCKKNCVKTWSNGEEIIIRHWESIDLYLANNPYCGDVCRKDTRTCNDWNLSQANANYHYLSCQIQIHTGNQCNDEEYNIEENEKIQWWKY